MNENPMYVCMYLPKREMLIQFLHNVDNLFEIDNHKPTNTAHFNKRCLYLL